MCAMHEPQSLPALHFAPTESTHEAPEAIADRTVDSNTAWHEHTSICSAYLTELLSATGRSEIFRVRVMREPLGLPIDMTPC